MGQLERRVIELCGLPGSGKSTVAGELARQRNGFNPDFLTLNEAIATPRVPLGKLGRWLSISIPAINRLLYRGPRQRDIAESMKKSAFNEFIDVCLAGLSIVHGPPTYRLLSYRRLSELIEKYTLLDGLGAPMPPVLVDEGLAQKAHAIAAPDDLNYFRTLPPLACVIHLSIDPDTALERLRVRAPERITIRHSFMTEKQIHHDLRVIRDALDAGLALLADRGIPVISVDSSAPFDDTLEAVRSAVKSVCERQ